MPSNQAYALYYEFFRKCPICLIFLRKSPESLMYDQLLFLIGFKWWSKNSDAFSMRVAQLGITGRPGTLKSSSEFWVANVTSLSCSVLIVMQEVFHLLF